MKMQIIGKTTKYEKNKSLNQSMSYVNLYFGITLIFNLKSIEMYILNYRTKSPYSKWYISIKDMTAHVKGRCNDIEMKFNQKQEDYNAALAKEYARGEEYGLMFEQNADFYEEELNRIQELISLEGEIESTCEKVLKEIYDTIMEQPKERGCLQLYMDEIERCNHINNPAMKEAKKTIRLMIEKRNRSEHVQDIALREIYADYIAKISEAVYNYVDKLLQELYNKY